MRYREIQPRGALARFIECFWILESAGAELEARSAPETVFPDGCIELILNFGQPFRQVKADGIREPQPRSFLVGQIRAPLMVEPSSRPGILGIRFRPGGSRAFFPFPQHELTGRVVALDLLWNRQAGELEERNLGAASHHERVHAAEQFLLARLNGGDRPDAGVEGAVACILAANGGLSITELAGRMGVSARRLERRFRDQVGISAKLFSRIIRFHSILKAMESKNGAQWVRLALEAGYYDQAHFISEFKEFSGQTPASYGAQEQQLAEYFARKNRPDCRVFPIQPPRRPIQ